jgi:hypothetical protein
MAQKSPGDGDSSTRGALAWVIIGCGVIGIVAVSIAVIWSAKDHGEASRYVFAGVVPLFSTWVGAVIAYYFTRQSLEAATESTLRLTGGLTADTPVADVMIPRAKLTTHDLKAGENAADVLLKDLLDAMTAAGFHRIPILDPAGAVLHVVHDSTINAFAPAPAAEKISDLPPALRKAIDALGFVGKSAIVKDARAAMNAVPGCNDVFVTESGKREDPIVGWLTNTDLAAIQ